MNERELAALSSAIYVARQAASGVQITEDDQKIRAAGVFDDWKTGKHDVGEVFNTYSAGELGDEWSQTWEVYQGYDNATYPDTVPGNPAWYTFNRPLHGKTPETARPFVAVQGAHDMYRFGEFSIWTDGLVYEVIDKNGTAYSPADYPAAWRVYGQDGE